MRWPCPLILYKRFVTKHTVLINANTKKTVTASLESKQLLFVFTWKHTDAVPEKYMERARMSRPADADI